MTILLLPCCMYACSLSYLSSLQPVIYLLALQGVMHSRSMRNAA